MTLHKVDVELAACFEPGHAYVALSRATSLEAARILSFDPVLGRRSSAEPSAVPTPARWL